MATWNVTSQAELDTAWAGAASGDIISLAAGSYTLVKTASPGPVWSPAVTIRSADAENPASFSTWDIRNVTGLTIEDVACDYASVSGAMIQAQPFQITSGSTNITARRVYFTGDTAFGLVSPGDVHNGFGTGRGLAIGSDADTILIEDCTFDGFWGAVSMGGCNNVTFQNNLIINTVNDGMFISAVWGLTISGNTFRNFVRNPDSEFHTDMIQMWTDASHPRANKDVTIDGNYFLKGLGDDTQIIFTRNGQAEDGDSTWNYQNITITNNLIWGSHNHCLHLGPTTTGRIANNTLIHNIYGGFTAEPVIECSSLSTGITIENNIAHGFPTAPVGSDWVIQNNLTIQRDSPVLPNYYADLFVNALNDGYAGLEDLQALPGGVIETGGYGAPVTIYDAAPAALTAVIRATPKRGSRTSVTFSAEYSAGPSGQIAA